MFFSFPLSFTILLTLNNQTDMLTSCINCPWLWTNWFTCLIMLKCLHRVLFKSLYFHAFFISCGVLWKRGSIYQMRGIFLKTVWRIIWQKHRWYGFHAFLIHPFHDFVIVNLFAAIEICNEWHVNSIPVPLMLILERDKTP